MEELDHAVGPVPDGSLRVVRDDPLEVVAQPAQCILHPPLAPHHRVAAVEQAGVVAHAGIGSSSEPKRVDHRLAQERVLRRLQAGILEQDLIRAVARAHEQLHVLGQARHPELRQAVLAGAEHVAGAAQLEVDLGEAEAVALAARSPRDAAASGSPNRMQSDACSPRPTRPRSWCSCESP